MVIANFHPFTKEQVEKTPHGIINKETHRYFTHRTKEHVFKKYQAFAISVSELELAEQGHCNHMVIKYHGTFKNIFYRISLEYLKYFKKHDNEGDLQVIIPIKEMEVIGEEVLENEDRKPDSGDAEGDKTET